MFELGEKRKDLFEKPTNDEVRRMSRKEGNDRQKRFAKLVGENFATFGLLAVMVVMVCSIWTEISIFTNWTRFFGEALTTIVLYILADIYATSLGSQGGKLDDGYLKDHKEYLDLRQRVRNIGIEKMSIFCDWQIDVEYEYYLRYKCKELKIDYNEYMEKYHDKTLEELQELFPMEKQPRKRHLKEVIFGGVQNVKTSSKAAKIFALNQTKHISLTPEILLTDGKVRNVRGGVAIGGEEYIEKHTTGWKHILITVLFAVVAVIPVVNLVREFSIAMLIYTIFKMALMLARMYAGYSRGGKAYNTVEPKHLQDKIKYLGLYVEFLSKGIYEELKDKYTVINEKNVENKRSDTADEIGTGGDS